MDYPEGLRRFIDAALPSHLPELRSLACSLARDTWGNERGQGRVSPTFTIAQAALSRIGLFAPQLHSLHLVSHEHELTIDVVATVLQCSQLKRLTLTARGGGGTGGSTNFSVTVPRVPVVDLSQLSLLRALTVKDLAIDTAQLSSFVTCCPALEDVDLDTVTVSLAILSPLSQYRRLRRLRLNNHTDWLYADPNVLSALRTVTAAVDGRHQHSLFSGLHFLSVHWSTRSYDPAREWPSHQVLSLLPAVFHSAPLHQLHLGLPYMSSDLHLFASFSQLKLLSLPHSAELEIAAAPFCLSRPCPLRHEWLKPLKQLQWMEEDMLAEEVASNARMLEEEASARITNPDCFAAAFKQEGSRAAFFEAVQDRAAARESACQHRTENSAHLSQREQTEPRI